MDAEEREQKTKVRHINISSARNDGEKWRLVWVQLHDGHIAELHELTHFSSLASIYVIIIRWRQWTISLASTALNNAETVCDKWCENLTSCSAVTF